MKEFFNNLITNHLWLVITFCVCLIAIIILFVFITKDGKKKKENKENVVENKKEEIEKPKEDVKEVENVTEEKHENKKSVKKSTTKKETKKQEEKVTPEKDDEEKKDEEKKEIKNAKYRLTYDKDKASWVIRKDGASRTIRRVKTKQEALEILKTMEEKNEDIKVVVHKKNGKFQKR